MNPDIFFKNFELLSDAPNGVQELRELILQLAVMGKLVPQDSNDEPASILLEKIKAEKKSLDKKGKNNGFKQLHPVVEDDIQFEVPNNWEIVRLGQVYDIEYGKSLSEKNRNNEGEFPVYGSNGIVGFHTEYLVDKPSLIIGRKGSAGAVNLSNKPFWPIDTAYFVTPKEGLDLLFSYYLFKTLDLGKFNKATAIPGLNRQDAYELIIKVPPLAEQKRIVSKVDELMALCDKLEARRQKKQEIQSKLNSAALGRMLSAENQEEFEQHWQRICENFDLLYDNPENVEKLRQAILQLAVHGKLVEQNPEDEPASVLIEKIDFERARLVKTGEIKRNKPLLIEFDKIPYDLPETWRWVRIGEVARNVEYGTSEKASEIEDGVPILRMNNVQNGKIDYEDLKYVPESIKDLPRLFLKHDDLLFNRTNSYELVGKTGIFKGEDDTFTLASYLIRVSLFNEHIVPDFINMSLNSSYFRKTQIEPEITQQCGQANFNGTKLKNSLIPLPPLAEQKRIVEKVEQLMGLCNELEAKLRKEREDSEKLMEAVVKGLLEGVVTEKPELEEPIQLQAAVIQLK